MDLVLLIGVAWCGLLVLVVALLAAASRADGRTDALLARIKPRPARRPRFTDRKPEHKLPGRPPAGDGAPVTRA